ncbi:MAG: substrate-binding domain-containing protein [Acidimicrobiales bacterium]
MITVAVAVAVVVVVLALCLVACGLPATSKRASTSPAGHGTVDVLYAGSLLRLMEQTLGPRFAAESGYRFSGFAGGSAELANEIKGGVRRGDIFVSASPDIDSVLQGAANGNWVSWYVSFARAPLVLGYNARSRFAAALRKRPWYEVVTSRGFLLGRTDPVLDPKGSLTVDALRRTAQRTGDLALLQIIGSSTNVFPEEDLLGRLEAGQLDAGFFYLDEARAAGIPTVALSPVSLGTTFTATVLNRAYDAAGALSFLQFLIGPKGRRVLGSAGFELLDPPHLHGKGAPAHLIDAINSTAPAGRR